jgi:arylsulfatase
LTNVRLDPFERTGMTGSMEFADWYKYEFWRFVFVQQEVGKVAQSFIDFPPMQAAASFNMEAVKQQIEAAIKSRQGN